MPLLSYSACVVNQLHGTGHKDTSELVTWLVTCKVWGIKSTVITAWSRECVTDSQKRKPRGRRTQEQREHETAQDVFVVFTWALEKTMGALVSSFYSSAQRGVRHLTLLLLQPLWDSARALFTWIQVSQPRTSPKAIVRHTLFHTCCLFPLLLPESVRDHSV